ncbi:MAG: hypothetical protein NC078_05765 [Ruminococcus sp.]|nr:hypothetical protein [Ruminococcus sp.]
MRDLYKLLLSTYISEERFISRLVIGIFRLMGFSPAKGYRFESYRKFIEKITRETGCSGFEVTYVKGAVPAAYAVITN